MNTHVSSLLAVTRVTMIRKENSRKEIEKEIRQYKDLLFYGIVVLFIKEFPRKTFITFFASLWRLNIANYNFFNTKIYYNERKVR